MSLIHECAICFGHRSTFGQNIIPSHTFLSGWHTMHPPKKSWHIISSATLLCKAYCPTTKRWFLIKTLGKLCSVQLLFTSSSNNIFTGHYLFSISNCLIVVSFNRGICDMELLFFVFPSIVHIFSCTLILQWIL